MTMLHIYEAIINQLEESLKTLSILDVKFSNSNLSESILRPSLRLEINTTTKQINASYKEKSHIAIIYYYAVNSDNYQIDNMKMEEIIENTFSKYIKLNCSCIPVSSIKFIIKNNTLITKIKFNYLEELIDDSEDSEEIMESLNISNKLS